MSADRTVRPDRTAADRRGQQGMTLIAALFLIVALGTLGLFAVRVGTSQQETVNLELLADRATVAANLGIEWAAVRTATTNACAATTLSPGGALAGFTVTITCVAHDHGVDGFVYAVTSRARYGSYGTPTFVSRTVTARLPT